MEDHIKYLRFVSMKEKTEKAFSSCEAGLKKKKAIQEVSRNNNILSVGYNSYLLSESDLKILMDEMGFKPYQAGTKKGLIARWIDKLAKSNKNSFGSKRLDCCDMNKKDN